MARVRTHPGVVLREELRIRGMSANQLALAIRVPATALPQSCAVTVPFRRRKPCVSGDPAQISRSSPSSVVSVVMLYLDLPEFSRLYPLQGGPDVVYSQ